MELLNLLHPLARSYGSATSIRQFIVELLHLSPMQRHRKSQRLEVYIHIVPHVVSKEHIFVDDDEEKLILSALEKDEIQLSDPSKDELKAMKAAAKRTFKKNQRVIICLYDHDFTGIQKKALEMGIPYQTLISGIIHRYVEGDIKIKPA